MKSFRICVILLLILFITTENQSMVVDAKMCWKTINAVPVKVRGFGDRRSGTEDSKQEAETAKEEVKTDEASRSKVAQDEVYNVPNDAPISVALSVSVKGLVVVGSEGIDGSGSTVLGNGLDLVDSSERSKDYVVDEKANDRLVEEIPQGSVCGRGQDV
ncbi:hypothetical protein ACOSP7_022191 [Xanthoceras sorbifolium]